MALVEINLRRPALIEEVVEPGKTEGSILGRKRAKTEAEAEGEKGTIRGKLAMAGLVLAVVAIVRSIRNRQSKPSPESEGVEVPIEDGSSSSDERGRSGRLRMLGIALAVVGAAAAARRLREPIND